MNDDKNLPDEFWRKKLTPEQYNIVRQKGTEAPFSGAFVNNFETGMYECVACGQQLFSSDTKFNSDCGWSSFDRAVEGNVEFIQDSSHGMHRTEVVCANCGGHLGHIFDDGPKHTTGKRFCINSLALNFKQQSK